MRISIPIKITVAVILAGLTIYFIVTLFSEGKIDSSEFKQEFDKNIQQAGAYRNIQLDSAKVYADSAVELAKEAENELWLNQSELKSAELYFLSNGSNDSVFRKVVEIEKWFRKARRYKSAFKANLLRLKLKRFLVGANATSGALDSLVASAKMCGGSHAMAQAYYFKMDNRDIRATWEDDVHILDSARMFAQRAKDTVLLSKIRMMSVLPINGSAASFDSTFLSLFEAKKWDSPELKCLSYETLGMEFSATRKVDSALFYLEKGNRCANAWGSKVRKVNLNFKVLQAYRREQNHDSVLAVGARSVKLASLIGDKDIELVLLQSMAVSSNVKGKYDNGIEFAMQALEIAKESQDAYNVSKIQKSLVYFLISTDRLDEARKILSEMLVSMEELDDNFINDVTRSIVISLQADLMISEKKLDSALYYLHKGRHLLRNHTAKRQWRTDYMIFTTYLYADSLEKAHEEFQYMNSKYTGRKLIKPEFYYFQGRLMYKLGDRARAIMALEKFLRSSVGLDEKYRFHASVLLSKLYGEMSDFKRAFDYSKQGTEIKMKMDSINTDLKLERSQAKYDMLNKETEIAELKIDRLEQEKSITEQENKLQSRRLYIILLSVFLVLLVVIILLLFNRAKQARVREGFKLNALEKEKQMELLKSEEAERSIELKNQLFANISHEFRTPLTLIQAPVEELIDNAESNEKKSLQVVKRNTDHLLVMVDEILELSKLDSGSASLTKKAFGLNSFIQKLEMNFDPIFRQKSIQFDARLPKDNISIEADEYRLKMVLNNLLKNAFHHTDTGGKIKMEVLTSGAPESINLSLFNSGKGIDNEFLPTVFDRYSRSKDEEYSGYGIGLSFCKEIIALHGGTISAENVDGGVMLSFSIPTRIEPVKSTKAQEKISTLGETASSEITGSKVLVVEDNLEMQGLLRDILKDQYELEFANNGEEGITMAKEGQPDLIISDVMMPKVEGTELARTLKEEFSTSHIPIILLTAKATDDDRISGLETGADNYLTKPFSPKELKIRIKNLIEQRERLRRRFSKNVFLKPEELVSTSLDQEFLLKATESVESNLMNPEFNVDRFCRSLALNRNSVHQKLKSLTGFSASQFIKSIKLRKAAMLLADERISIVEVSELSGFNNRQAFNKAFKTQFTITPSEYRKKCIEES